MKTETENQNESMIESFDSLVKAVGTEEVRQPLSQKGHTHLIIQMGRGSFVPTKVKTGKPLIVVDNEDLMDNHQEELAEELAERKHLYCDHHQTLYETISAMDRHQTLYETISAIDLI